MIVPIVFSVSDFYAPYFAVCLQSMQEYTCATEQYRLIILEKNVDEFTKTNLKSMLCKSNIQLDFFDMRPIIGKKRFHAHDHVSDETFFKLFVPKLFPEYKKIMFCDADILFKDDPSKLFRIDMGMKKIAAAPCHLWHGIIQNNSEAYEYTINQLKIKNLDSYFQAGVLLFQPPYITQQDIQTILHLAETREFLCMDQDILNAVFQEDLYLLNSRWNYETSQPTFRRNSIPYMNEIHRKRWIQAGKNPAVIHYSGEEKPWTSSIEGEYVDLWWQTAKRTPYYERLKSRFDCTQIVNQKIQQLRAEFVKYHFPNINGRFEKNEREIELVYVIEHCMGFKLEKWCYAVKKMLSFGKKQKKYQQKYDRIKKLLREAESLRENLPKA